MVNKILNKILSLISFRRNPITKENKNVTIENINTALQEAQLTQYKLQILQDMKQHYISVLIVRHSSL